MKKRFFSRTILVLLLSPVIIKAQLTSYKEPDLHHKRNAEFVLATPAKGKFYSLEYAERYLWLPYVDNKWKHIKVISYDKDLNQISKKNIEALKKKGMLGLNASDGHVNIFYSEKKKKLFLAKVDLESAQVVSDPIFLFETKKKITNLYKGFSADSNYTFVFTRGYSSNIGPFDGVVLDKKNKIINKFSFNLDNLEGELYNFQPFLTTQGKFYIIFTLQTASAKKGLGLKSYVTEFSNSGAANTTAIENIPEGNFQNITFSELKDGIKLTGGIFIANALNAKKIIAVNFNSHTKKFTDLKVSDFTQDPYWKTIKNKRLVPYQTEGLNLGAKVDHYIQENGDEIRVTQHFNEYTVQTSKSIYYRTAGRDITVVCFSPDLKIRWFYQIPLSQQEFNSRIWIGFISTWQPGKGLYIFFNDHTINHNIADDQDITTRLIGPSKEDITNAYVIRVTPNGEITRNIIGKHLDLKHRFAPADSFSIFGNQLLVSSASYGGTKRMGWRPALITIN